jgi:glucose/arabinose dehydrogenase
MRDRTAKLGASRAPVTRRTIRLAVTGAATGLLLTFGTSATGTASLAREPVGSDSRQQTFRLQRMMGGFRQPTFVTSAPGERNRLYVVQRGGVVRVIENGRLRARPFLNISSAVRPAGEGGLLSIAFHPSYATTRLVYAFFTDEDLAVNIAEYRVASGSPSRVRTIIRVRHDDSPFHVGGQLAFGPDGSLYVGIGDGGYLTVDSGSGVVRQPDPHGNSQNLTVLLGKIFPLDVREQRPEPRVLAYGLRNPWRFSFDPTGNLIIGDVGWNTAEEIDVLPAGAAAPLNFGWSVYEGRTQRRTEVQLDPTGELTAPAHVYPTRGNCAVTGGYVYRGPIRALQGRYVFGDHCSGRIWSGRVAGGRLSGVRIERHKLPQLTSFGIDSRGGLYAVTLGGALYRFSS